MQSSSIYNYYSTIITREMSSIQFAMSHNMLICSISSRFDPLMYFSIQFVCNRYKKFFFIGSFGIMEPNYQSIAHTARTCYNSYNSFPHFYTTKQQQLKSHRFKAEKEIRSITMAVMVYLCITVHNLGKSKKEWMRGYLYK